ncbi:hypothetical protein BS78_01G412200 [Paspalum vaginatum]|nr:hypothetical protein BS78_01G412200 [Paspalum vaginatum]KAJ1297885.1 hypothetical protein BS78_01G412200 [Paspalum vaginatum]KAJ1297886.1 hypothetical protein BS78_01G412200 [Paspalum vaginatum]
MLSQLCLSQDPEAQRIKARSGICSRLAAFATTTRRKINVPGWLDASKQKKYLTYTAQNCRSNICGPFCLQQALEPHHLWLFSGSSIPVFRHGYGYQIKQFIHSFNPALRSLQLPLTLILTAHTNPLYFRLLSKYSHFFNFCSSS